MHAQVLAILSSCLRVRIVNVPATTAALVSLAKAQSASSSGCLRFRGKGGELSFSPGRTNGQSFRLVLQAIDAANKPERTGMRR